MDSLLTAIVPILAALGGGIAFVWGKLEKRFAAIEKKLEDCEKRDAANRSRLSELLFALRMMADEMHASDPMNPLLKTVRQMLVKAYPIPRDMEEQLERMP
jgi:hypothetical protein